MESLLQPPPRDSVVLGLSVLLFVLSCLNTFDKRLVQAKREGFQPEQELPAWTNIFLWVYYPLFVVLAILNWQWAILLYVVLFILAVLPVSETIGNLLYGMLFAPFRRHK